MIALILASTLLSQVGISARPLEAQVRDIAAASGAEVAVAYRTLDGRGELLVDADQPFHAASTMKLPVMIELFRQADSGMLSLEDPLPVRNEFHSIVDGSTFTLSEGDDSDKDVYAAVGRTLTLRQLCEAMIIVSSNFAANLLIERLGVQHIRRTVQALGADGMQVLRGVEDQKAYDEGMNNTTTARGLMVLLDRLAHGTAVSARADAEMIDILKRQRFNSAIPAGLPPGTPVAHKTGNITRIHHDAAIVYGPSPYVLVVLVRGIDELKKSAALMAEISKAVYGHTVDEQRSNPRLP
jgi:beta-lactamase class A